MTLLTIAIPVALLVAAVAVAAFIWAVRNDQFDDLDTPPRRMLLDDPSERCDVRMDAEAASPSTMRSREVVHDRRSAATLVHHEGVVSAGKRLGDHHAALTRPRNKER